MEHMVSEFKPLRPSLYNTLKNMRWSGGVLIAHRGEKFKYQASFDNNGKPRCQIVHWGEVYRVNCPFCGDRRHRLWIPYVWGLPDPYSNVPMLWLAHCFNEEQCLHDSCNQKKLFDMIYGVMPPLEESVDSFSGDHDFGENDMVSDKVLAELPGECVLLTDLPDDHPACQFVVRKGFDKNYIADHYSVSFCEKVNDSRYSLAEKRLIIPVVCQGKLVGWQARTLGRGRPKYWSMPGMTKSQVLYGFDETLSLKPERVLVVEGPTDVWRYGDGAVAALGHSLSPYQISLLGSLGSSVILAFDPDVKDKTEKVAEDLREKGFNCGVLLLTRDPDEYSQQELREMVDRVEVI